MTGSWRKSRKVWTWSACANSDNDCWNPANRRDDGADDQELNPDYCGYFRAQAGRGSAKRYRIQTNFEGHLGVSTEDLAPRLEAEEQNAWLGKVEEVVNDFISNVQVHTYPRSIEHYPYDQLRNWHPELLQRLRKLQFMLEPTCHASNDLKRIIDEANKIRQDERYPNGQTDTDEGYSRAFWSSLVVPLQQQLTSTVNDLRKHRAKIKVKGTALPNE